jgi:hypothetical protein
MHVDSMARSAAHWDIQMQPGACLPHHAVPLLLRATVASHAGEDGRHFLCCDGKAADACMIHCRLVTPPADAAVHTLLMGPWRSEGFAGPESIVVPAAALAPGHYTVQLTATQPFTTFTLQVGRRMRSCPQGLPRPS